MIRLVANVRNGSHAEFQTEALPGFLARVKCAKNEFLSPQFHKLAEVKTISLPSDG
jgi:hypothetical protein